MAQIWRFFPAAEFGRPVWSEATRRQLRMRADARLPGQPVDSMPHVWQINAERVSRPSSIFSQLPGAEEIRRTITDNMLKSHVLGRIDTAEDPITKHPRFAVMKTLTVTAESEMQSHRKRRHRGRPRDLFFFFLFFVYLFLLLRTGSDKCILIDSRSANKAGSIPMWDAAELSQLFFVVGTAC